MSDHDAPHTEENFLTTEEVLEYLQVNLRTVYRLIRTHRLPAMRVGRQWRFRKRDLDAWLDHGRKGDKRGGANGELPRVLVVDDDDSVRSAVAKALVQAQYDVDTAIDGLTALERLRAANYDLLITDLKMPGMDGLSVIREARREDPDIPIVIITGASTEASAIEAINLGVSGYLTKPFRVNRVVAVAARAMGEPAVVARAGVD